MTLNANIAVMAETLIDADFVDYLILATYFAFVLGIGFMARRQVSDSVDFFLSGRSLPAWVTGLAFISANLGAVEIMGMSASGAEFGLPTVHYFWVGADPGDALPRRRDDAVLLRLEGPVGPGVHAPAVRSRAPTWSTRSPSPSPSC